MASRLEKEESEKCVVYENSNPTHDPEFLHVSSQSGHGEETDVGGIVVREVTEEDADHSGSFSDPNDNYNEVKLEASSTPHPPSDSRAVSGKLVRNLPRPSLRKAPYSTPGVSEKSVLHWMKEVYMDNPHGKVDCRLVKDMVFDKFNCRKRMIATWIRKAFPNIYLRRSDRNRWYCGISLRGDEGQTDMSDEDKIWINQAVEWLKSSMEMDPGYKEKCASIHRALIDNIGSISVDKAIAAFKMVFPNVPRKTYNRIAYYCGIRFRDTLLRSEYTEPMDCAIPAPHDDSKSQFLNSAANKLIVCWLQRALISDRNARSKLGAIKRMIKDQFGRDLPLKRVGQLTKRAFPGTEYKIKGLADGIIWGVAIDEACKPNDSWTHKAVEWLKSILDVVDDSYTEETKDLFALMKKKLTLDCDAKYIILLREAFPDNAIKEVDYGCVMSGLHLRESAKLADSPEFTEDDISVRSHLLDPYDDAEDDERALDDMTGAVDATPTTENNTPTMVHISSHGFPLEHCLDGTFESQSSRNQLVVVDEEIKQRLTSLETHVTSLDEKLSDLLQNTTDLKEELKKIREENYKSAQQKDSLILQLQQTLIMLCQHQLQKVIPEGQDSPDHMLTGLLQKGFSNQNT